MNDKINVYVYVDGTYDIDEVAFPADLCLTMRVHIELIERAYELQHMVDNALDDLRKL